MSATMMISPTIPPGIPSFMSVSFEGLARPREWPPPNTLRKIRTTCLNSTTVECCGYHHTTFERPFDSHTSTMHASAAMAPNAKVVRKPARRGTSALLISRGLRGEHHPGDRRTGAGADTAHERVHPDGRAGRGARTSAMMRVGIAA